MAPAGKEQTFVRFLITSPTLSAAEIQSRLGLAPDESWKVGQARGNFGNIEKSHGFALESKEPPHGTLDAHVKAMLKRLAPYAQKIGALPADSKVELSCSVHRKTAPALKFDRDDLRWLGVMGARLDIDILIVA